MNRIYRRIRDADLKTKLIMQVHDELVLEAPVDELEKVKDMVQEEMEGVIDMVIPLKVSVSRGKNWGKIH